MTIGKTHSGKSTFANLVEKQLPNSVVLDQDNNAQFIHTFYEKLLPTVGPNSFKQGLSSYILHYAVQHSALHIILCNANLKKHDRLLLLETFFPKEHFIHIIVHFHIPEEILLSRIRNSSRITTIFRDPSMTFEQLLIRQQKDSEENVIENPSLDEADYLFTIQNNEDATHILQEILFISKSI